MEKKIIIIILILLYPFSLFSDVYFSPNGKMTAGVYFAIPQYDYLLTSDVPIRTHGNMLFDVDFISISYNKFQFGLGISIGEVSKSIPYGNSVFKGFTQFGFNIDTSLFVTENLAIGLGGRLMDNILNSPNDRFAAVEGYIWGEYLYEHTNYVNYSVIVPLTVSYRKDIIGISFGLGLKVKMLAKNQEVQW